MSKVCYFEKPTQVRFWDIQPQDYVGGIGYRDEIFCGECGHVMKIADIYEEVAEEAAAGELAPPEDEVIQELAWIPIDQEILGDDFRARQRVETTTEPPHAH